MATHKITICFLLMICAYVQTLEAANYGRKIVSSESVESKEGVKSDESLTSEEKDNKSLTSEEKDNKSLTSEEKDNKSLTSEEKDDKSLTSEEKDNKSLTSEEKDNKSLTSEEKDNKSLTSEENDNKSVTSEEKDSKSLTSEEKDDKSLTSEETGKGAEDSKNKPDEIPQKKVENVQPIKNIFSSEESNESNSLDSNETSEELIQSSTAAAGNAETSATVASVNNEPSSTIAVAANDESSPTTVAANDESSPITSVPNVEPATEESTDCISPGIFKYKNDCRKSYTCLDNGANSFIRLEHICPPQKSINVELGWCIRDISTCDNVPVCTQYGTIANPSDSTSYYWCIGNMLGQFNEYLVRCDPNATYQAEVGDCVADLTKVLQDDNNMNLNEDDVSDRDAIRAERKLLKQQKKLNDIEMKLSQKFI